MKPTTNAVRRGAMLALRFFLGVLIFALNTGYAHAQEAPPPITVQVQFVNVDFEAGKATLGPNSCSATGSITPASNGKPAPVTCVSNSEVSLTSTAEYTLPSTADVKITLDNNNNWTITQTVTTPAVVDDCVTPINCGGTAVLVVNWSLPVQKTNAAATLSATLQQGGDAGFLWGAEQFGTFCAFVEFPNPNPFGPQCQGHPSGNDYLLGASYTKSLAAPGITPIPSYLKLVGGQSYVACGPDSGACTATVATTVMPGDEITLSNTSGNENGIWVNGLIFPSGPQWDHQTFTSSMDTIQLGANLTHSDLDSGNEVVAFTNRRPPTLKQDAGWTRDPDDAMVDFRDEIEIPLQFWIISGDVSKQTSRISRMVARTNSVWVAERMGTFATRAITDETGALAAKKPPVNLDVVTCSRFPGMTPSIDSLIPPTGTQLNIYLVNTIEDLTKTGGTIGGLTCKPNVILIASEAGNTDLVHEIGHAMSLRHPCEIDELSCPNSAYFDPSNVMWPTEEPNRNKGDWQADHLFAHYDLIQPKSNNAGNYVFEVTNTFGGLSGGFSGTTEPVWPQTQGQSVSDEGLTWTNAGTTDTSRDSLVQQFLTEGQTFRTQFSPDSAINTVYGKGSGFTQDCPRDSPTTPYCPAYYKRIWADGVFPPN